MHSGRRGFLGSVLPAAPGEPHGIRRAYHSALIVASTRFITLLHRIWYAAIGVGSFASGGVHDAVLDYEAVQVRLFAKQPSPRLVTPPT